MSLKKTLKEGLNPKKQSNLKEEKFSSSKAQDKAMKAFKKMSRERGEMPI
tara:strand:- start:2424 stop:2573 length:150 start_codon:yes stop_codon:yes gene_type:complete